MSKALEALKNIEKQYNQLGIKFEESGWHIREDDYFAIQKELKALEIITKYPRDTTSLNYLLDMMKYWEKENKTITKELLETYDFPYTVEEYDLLKEVLL